MQGGCNKGLKSSHPILSGLAEVQCPPIPTGSGIGATMLPWGTLTTEKACYTPFHTWNQRVSTSLGILRLSPKLADLGADGVVHRLLKSSQINPSNTGRRTFEWSLSTTRRVIYGLRGSNSRSPIGATWGTNSWGSFGAACVDCYVLRLR